LSAFNPLPLVLASLLSPIAGQRGFRHTDWTDNRIQTSGLSFLPDLSTSPLTAFQPAPLALVYTCLLYLSCYFPFLTLIL
jgi:hypothetical protein